MDADTQRTARRESDRRHKATVPVAVTFPADLLERIDTAAAHELINRSAWMRRACAAALARPTQQEAAR